MGFYDKNGIYPLKSVVDTGDTDVNRNATANNVLYKNMPTKIRYDRRITEIEIRNFLYNGLQGTSSYNSFVLEEPLPAYHAAYPYNHVKFTESGHIEEYDDTPGAERINWQHRCGTYEEWDNAGGCTKKVLGDYYDITVRDKVEFINGDYVLKVGGNMWLDIEGDFIRYVGGCVHDHVQGNRNEYTGSNKYDESGCVIEKVAANKYTVVNGAIFEAEGLCDKKCMLSCYMPPDKELYPKPPLFCRSNVEMWVATGGDGQLNIEEPQII